MNRPLILTYDVGTQSTRAILVDKQGNIVDKEQVSTQSLISGSVRAGQSRKRIFTLTTCARHRRRSWRAIPTRCQISSPAQSP